MTSNVTRRARFAGRRTRQKIRKVGPLIQLSASVKSQRVREDAQVYSQSSYRDSQSVNVSPKKCSLCAVAIIRALSRFDA
jgi:hypothetical protein